MSYMFVFTVSVLNKTNHVQRELRTPKRQINPTSVCDRDLWSEITMAPKNRGPENLVRFLQDVKEIEEYE